MKEYLLVNQAKGKMIPGVNLTELLADPSIQFTVNENRRVVLNGVEDTISFSPEFNDMELAREARARVLSLLFRQGWQLYERRMA